MPWIMEGTEILACISAHDPEMMRKQTIECLEHRIKVIYDPGQQVSTIPPEDLMLGIEVAEVIIVNEFELSLLCKRTGITEAELQSSVPIVIKTKGEKGSVIASHDEPHPINVSIAKPSKIIDPTGAGDAYRAGFIFGYLRQWGLKECGQLGSVVSSFALENQGPQADVTQEQIKERYEATFNERIDL
jgi:adenosine kinase